MTSFAISLREAHWAIEVAPIRNVDYGQAWLILASGAAVTVSIARFYNSLLRIRKYQPVPLFKVPVQI
jgi:hypothetical protein